MKNKIIAVLTAIACLGLIAGHATEASAQASRTWVSGVGDDANPCSRTAPCKTFAGAISKTADGGIIDALDPGGFGAVSITKGITLRGTGTTASILASNTNGVNINAPGKVVNLIDIAIDGSPTSLPGFIGVNVIAAAHVMIDGVTIQGFKAGLGTGVRLVSAAITQVDMTNTRIFSNKVGLDIAPLSPPKGHHMVLNNVLFIDNPTSIQGNTDKTLVAIRGSVVDRAITLTNGAIIRSYSDNVFPPGFTPTQTVALE